MNWKEYDNTPKANRVKGIILSYYGFNSEDDIIAAGYEYHHSATRRGYHTRDYKEVRDYAGTFGVGLVLVENNPASNRYGIKISYYIKKK